MKRYYEEVEVRHDHGILDPEKVDPSDMYLLIWACAGLVVGLVIAVMSFVGLWHVLSC